MKHLLYALIVTLLYSCSMDKQEDELSKLSRLMSGKFSSKMQAETDSAYYNISLVMVPIWKTNTGSKWLYVEQAVAEMMDKPYRQRVYQLIQLNDSIFESKVFSLPNPEKFVHAWNNPEVFMGINEDSLLVRVGCSVFLKKSKDGCYSGSTLQRHCLSNFRGAAYATSEVSICTDKIISWDRGWDDKDEQVWGAEKGGYFFEKLN